MRNELDSDEILFTIQKAIGSATRRLKMALPRGWRLIVAVGCKSIEGTPPHELMYLDVQADEGGGSWAKAKIQTLQKCPGWVATHPMEMGEINEMLKYLGFSDCEEAELVNEAFLYADLTQENIAWLVNTENGPGLAPNFGGIRIPYSCNFIAMHDDPETGGDKAKMEAEDGEVLIAFSGAAAWQDLQFALVVARAMKEYWDNKEDEFLTMDFEPLKEYPEIDYWMTNLGLR